MLILCGCPPLNHPSSSSASNQCYPARSIVSCWPMSCTQSDNYLAHWAVSSGFHLPCNPVFCVVILRIPQPDVYFTQLRSGLLPFLTVAVLRGTSCLRSTTHNTLVPRQQQLSLLFPWLQEEFKVIMDTLYLWYAWYTWYIHALSNDIFSCMLKLYEYPFSSNKDEYYDSKITQTRYPVSTAIWMEYLAYRRTRISCF